MPEDQLDLLGDPPQSTAGRLRKRRALIERAEVQEAVNDLFQRAMKADPRTWLNGLLSFLAHMRRYSIFTAKLIYMQRPGAVAVGTKKYWAGQGRSIRPGAIPLIILAPNGPVVPVYELEDTEKCGGQLNLEGLGGPIPQRLSEEDWNTFKRNVELFGSTPKRKVGMFRLLERGLGSKLYGDVHYARDRYDRFVVRLNRRHQLDTRFLTLVHEMAHVFCGHAGAHPLGWWPDRRRLPGIASAETQNDIMEFEAEAVSWIVARRNGLTSDAPDYLADKIAPLDNERLDMNAVLDAANRIEVLMG